MDFRPSSMTFLSDPGSHRSHYSHRVRIVLAEKAVTVRVVDVNSAHPPPELAANPYHSLPTLMDRDLVLWDSKVMMEYLDERFPHPPLLPVYPVARANSRQYMSRIERDWCERMDSIYSTRSSNVAKRSTKELREHLLAAAPIFSEKPYFMSDEFTLVDCCIAPVLWRLSALGIEFRPGRQANPLLAYMERIFNRDSFQMSLSEAEREMRR